ncbi:MAG: flippase [Lysobacterales bacterium]|jgi:O-antigen/teichoic acid export membrane protein
MSGNPNIPSTPSETSRRLARNFGWLTVQELLIRLIGLATAIYLARTLSESGYGALGVALSIAGMAQVLVQAGTGNRATRLTARDPSSVPEIYAQTMGMRLLAAVMVVAALVAAAPVLSRVFSVPAVLLILCTLPLMRRALSVTWAFRGLDQMQINTLANVGEKILTLLGLVLLVHGRGNDLLWAPVAEFAAAMLMVAWLRRRLRDRYPELHLRFRPRDWPPIIREALPLGLAALLNSVYLHGGVLLLGWFASTESAAGFLVAQKVMLTLIMLLLVIQKSAFPTTSRLMAGDPAPALRLAARLMRYYLVIIVPVFLLVAFHAGAVLTLLYGAAYTRAGAVLFILLMALPFVAVSNMLQFLLMAIPLPRAVLLGRAAGAIVLVLQCALWIPRLGAEGAALAVVAGELASMAILFLFVRRATGGQPWNIRCFAPLAAGAIAAILYAVCASWPVAMKLPLAALAYLASALMLGAVTPAELRTLVPLLRSLSPEAVLRGGSGEEAENRAGVEGGAWQHTEENPQGQAKGQGDNETR